MNGETDAVEPPDVWTVKGPVRAPAGTVAERPVAETAVVVPTTPPPKITVSALIPVGSKPVPLMLTVVPVGPLVGLKLEIVG